MENSNQENNVQEQTEWMNKLHELMKAAPTGINHLIFADGKHEDNKEMILISAKGKPADLAFVVATAINKDPLINLILTGASYANKSVPSSLFDFLNKQRF